MAEMGRRDSLGQAAAMAAATLSGEWSRAVEQAATTAPSAPAGPLHAWDTVVLGRTGIRTSRLALGTGTKVSRQREMGERGLLKLFRHALDRGVRWWDVADLYGTHPLVRAVLKQIPRDKVVITSKTQSKDADGVRADVERFRAELGTDYIDILLLHCLRDRDWPTSLRGAMDALSEAKEKGHVRAVGCSCHDLGALRAAADEPWVDVCLARINPFAVIMDVKKPADVPKVVATLRTMADRGKGVYGMKILGEGRLKGRRIDTSLRFALKQEYLTGFVIGFRSIEEFDDLLQRMQRVQA